MVMNLTAPDSGSRRCARGGVLFSPAESASAYGETPFATWRTLIMVFANCADYDDYLRAELAAFTEFCNNSDALARCSKTSGGDTAGPPNAEGGAGTASTPNTGAPGTSNPLTGAEAPSAKGAPGPGTADESSSGRTLIVPGACKTGAGAGVCLRAALPAAVAELKRLPASQDWLVQWGVETAQLFGSACTDTASRNRTHKHSGRFDLVTQFQDT